MANTNEPHQSSLKEFDDHFAAPGRYGERWQKTLYPALKSKPRHAMLCNRYASLQDFYRVAGPPESLKRIRFPSAVGDIQADNLVCFVREDDFHSDSTSLPRTRQTSQGPMTGSRSDAASVLAAHILQVLPGDNVLDLYTRFDTSLALAQPIWPYLMPDSSTPPLPGAKKGALHSNDSPDLNRRRAGNLLDFLPIGLAHSGQVRVTQIDAITATSELPLGLGGYDKVFVEVPSSNERRIVQAQAQVGPGQVSEELARWRPKQSESLAAVRAQFLLAALRAVRVGGRVVYSTRSISREENDGVVEKVLGQMEGGKSGNSNWTAEVESLNGEVEKRLEAEWAERTAKGWIVLPDRSGESGWGPRYFCVLTKKSD